MKSLLGILIFISVSVGFNATAVSAECDLNGDGNINLNDAVLVFQILVQQNPQTSGTAASHDIGTDGRIGTEEAIYILQTVAGLADAIPEFTVPDTGQTACYNAAGDHLDPCPQSGQSLYGQDASYTINPPSYAKMGEEGTELPADSAEWLMVMDNVTGLIWEAKQAKDENADYSNPNDADNLYTWYDSDPETNGGEDGKDGDGTDTEDFIKALNDSKFGGFDDWRLPTLRELAFIVNHATYNPTVDTNIFPGTNSEAYYWSATTAAYYVDMAWTIDFYSAGSTPDLDFADNKDHRNHVRAVRGQNKLSDSHIIDDLRTVTDKSTGLMWQQDTSENTMIWEDALDYCESLTFSDYDDWRLPNINELRSIVNYSKYFPAVDTDVFPLPDKKIYYWSSTTSQSKGRLKNAWNVFIYTGFTASGYKSESNYVRCVRGLK